MKNLTKLFFAVALFFASTFIFAQAPEGFNYQAVIRDGSANIIANGSVNVQFTIEQGSAGGTAVYQETHNLTTNAYGLVTANIGEGTVVSGTFSSIAWSSDKYYLKVEVDPAGGTSYSDLGTSKFMSVPYALNAKIADAFSGNKIELFDSTGSELVLRSQNSALRILSLQNGTNYLQSGTSNNSGSTANLRFTGYNGSPFHMVLTGDGKLGIGEPTPNYLLEVNGDAAKPGGGAWTASSDARLKKEVVPYKDGLQTLLAIKPVKFHYNEKSGHDTHPEYVGVIAQQLKKVAPYMVGTFEKEGKEYLNVDNSAMTYMLINAIQEQQAQIKELKAENSTLKAKLENENKVFKAEIEAIKAQLGMELQGKK